MNDTQIVTPSQSKPKWISVIQDDVTDRLSHSKLINLLGAVTASGLMVFLSIIDKMNEGYFGLYVGAVLAQAIGYKVVSKNANSSNSGSSPSGT